MEIFFTEAKESEMRVILEMMRAFCALDSYPFDVEIRRENLSQFIANRELGRLFLIRNEQDIVGYIALTFGYSFEYQGRDAFIDEFYIRDDFRSQGVGKATLDFVEGEARRLGVHAIHLEVEGHNKAADGLYRRKGFVGNNRALLTKRIE
jgi:GNAT superfamily N-acetyltransferase